MNTNIRSILSTSTALGLVSFTIASAFVLGSAAPATVLSFGLLAVYGLLEIAVMSYQAPRRVFSSARLNSKSIREPARMGAVIHYPVTKRQVLARAA